MAIAGVLIGAICDEFPISLPVLIGQLGGLAIVLCGSVLMADGLMAVIWADKGGKLMWLFWLIMCAICGALVMTANRSVTGSSGRWWLCGNSGDR